MRAYGQNVGQDASRIVFQHCRFLFVEICHESCHRSHHPGNAMSDGLAIEASDKEENTVTGRFYLGWIVRDYRCFVNSKVNNARSSACLVAIIQLEFIVKARGGILTDPCEPLDTHHYRLY